MKQTHFILSLKSALQNLLSLILLLCLSLSTAANTNTFSCATEAQQQALGALPDFDSSHSPLLGFNCQLTPYISSYRGNWFPSLPEISYSQGYRSQILTDDIKQDWGVSLSIKRIAQGQLYVFANQNLSKFTVQANNNIAFIPHDTKTTQHAIQINTQKNVRLSHQQDSWGFGLQFPYIEDQPLTKVLFRQTTLEQPMQADILGLPDRSLFYTSSKLTEIEIANQSHHRGLNINWHFAMGMGEIEIKPKALTSSASSKEHKKIISLGAGLEAYYHYRINRRWFAYTRAMGEIQYWNQTASDPLFDLEAYQKLVYQVDLGLGMSF